MTTWPLGPTFPTTDRPNGDVAIYSSLPGMTDTSEYNFML